MSTTKSARRRGGRAAVRVVSLVALATVLPSCATAHHTTAGAATCAARVTAAHRSLPGPAPADPATIRGDDSLRGGFDAAPLRQIHTVRWRSGAMTEPSRSFVASASSLVVSDDPYLCAVDLATGALRWSRHTPRLTGTPSVSGSRVLLASSDRPSLQVFDLRDGRLLWQVQTGPGAAGFPQFAVGAGSTVYATGPTGVTAYDAGTGHTLWHDQIAGASAGLAIGGGTSGTSGATVYVVDGTGVLHALDAARGAARWNQPVASGARLSEVDGGIVLVSGTDLHALDAATGTPRWAYPRATVPGGVAADAAAVYVETATSGLYALAPATGRELWSIPEPIQAHFNTGPSITVGLLYVGDDHGDLHGFDLGDRKELWRFEASLLPGESTPGNPHPMTTHREFVGGPLVVARGTVFAADVSGVIYALS